MPSRDYIIRQIEQIGVVLRALLARILNRTATHDEIRAELQSALQQVGFDLDLAVIADADTLIRMIAPTGEVDPARAWLVAEALYLDGLEAALDDQVDRARLSLEKARRLFTMLDTGTPTPSGMPEARARVEDITARLASPPLS